MFAHKTAMFPSSGVALITGAASGIGSVVASSLSQEGCSQLVLADLDARLLETTAENLRKRGGRDLQILTVVCDVRKASDVEKMVQEAVKRFGAIHYCVNCAGVVSSASKTADTAISDFMTAPETNQRGMWLSMRAQVRQLLQQEQHPNGPESCRGSIVNLAASQGIGTAPSFPSYSAANYGIVGMTKATTMDYINSGIRFNCVCPGPTNTPGLVESGSKDYYIRSVPLRRVNKPDEVAAAVLFLLGETASGINGICLPVDGGWSLCHY